MGNGDRSRNSAYLNGDSIDWEGAGGNLWGAVNI